MSLLEISGLRGGYGAADEIVKGADARRRGGRDRRPDRPERRRQVDAAEADRGPAAAERRQRALQGPRHRRAGRRPTSAAPASSFVPQERNVFGTMSVAENLEMGGYHRRRACRGSAWTSSTSAFPMLADKRRAAARTLSGGQRQILAMAIALMNAPDLLLLDEPTAGLSPRAAEELFGTIVALNQGGRGDPDGRAERARGAGGVGARLRAGAGPRRARGTGGRRSPPIRRCAISFSAARPQPMLKSANEGRGTIDEPVLDRPPRGAAGGRLAAVAAPSVLRRAGRPDQDRDPDAAHRRRRLLRPGRWPRSPRRSSRRSTRRAACSAARSCW